LENITIKILGNIKPNKPLGKSKEKWKIADGFLH
jgi:hypothetical protein